MRTKKQIIRSIPFIDTLEPRRLFSETATASVALTSTTGSGSATVYNYSVTLNDTGSTPLGTFWFGWVPGQNFMSSSPTAITSAAGWTDIITHGGSTDGYAIQWTTSSAAVAAGASLTGFDFSSTDSLTVLAGNSTVNPTTPVETSFVYQGGPFSDAGYKFVAAAFTTPPPPPVATPPTATAAVALLSTTGAGKNKTYNYDITVTNTSTTTIGTFWFAWIPGQDYLHTSPTATGDPAGWSDVITHDGAADGYAIKWVAGTGADISAGQSLSAFKLSSHDSPKALATKSAFFKKTLVETSFVYSGAPFSDAGDKFVAAKPTVPPANSLLAKLPATPTFTASTVPANGDVNPYGVAIVPSNFAKGGTISAGDVLVSNFNDAAGLQGTGTTIVAISPTGQQSTFFQGRAGLGLTTALGTLRRGFVLVGNLPAPDGTNVQGPGSLLILDRKGDVVDTLSDANLLDGPWDLAVQDSGATANVFVSNVLNGTVTRLKLTVPATGSDLKVVSQTQIATGYAFRTDPSALVVGPTGLALAPNGTLYVAATGDNAIFSITGATTRKVSDTRGKLIFQDNDALRGPLALTFDGANLLVSNGDAVNADSTNEQNSQLIEITPTGKFVDIFQIDSVAGGAFGLAFSKTGNKIVLAAVDDVTNTLDEWILK